MKSRSIFNYQVRDATGHLLGLDQYKGQVTVVANIAGFCGFTHTNMQALTALQARYAAHPFTVLAFPCNQFANQEPRDACTVQSWAKDTYSATFPIFDSIKVKGPQADPLYLHLRSECGAVSWNFVKYVCDKDGIPIKRFEPAVPFCLIEDEIDALLGL